MKIKPTQRYTYPIFMTRYRIIGSKGIRKGMHSSHRIKLIQVLANKITEKKVTMNSLSASDIFNKLKGQKIIIKGLRAGAKDLQATKGERETIFEIRLKNCKRN